MEDDDGYENVIFSSEIVPWRYSNHFAIIPSHSVYQIYINHPEIKLV